MRLYLLLPGLLLFSSCGSDASGDRSTDSGQAVSVTDGGQKLFQQYCTTCHLMDQDMAGPKLRGALARWNNDTARLMTFIRNPAAMIESGDLLALQAKQRGRGGMMPAFPSLSDEEIKLLIDYIR